MKRLISINYTCALFLLALFFPSADSFGQTNLLLQDIQDSERATLRQINDYFLKVHLYDALNYRIVRVNMDALRSGEAIDIPLFNGRSVSIEPISTQVRNEGAMLIWNGRISNPSISVQELASQVGSFDQASAIHDSLFRVKFIAAQYETDQGSQLNIPYVAARRTGEQKPTGPKKVGGTSAQPFYGVTGSFRNQDSSSEYRIFPLEMGGPYHLLVELDQSKIVSPGPLNDADHPEMSQKRREREEYMRSLGDDPRKEILKNLERQEQ